MSINNILLDLNNPQLYNGQFNILRVNTLNVDNLGVDALTIGTSIMPLTGGKPWIGTNSLPFKYVSSLSYTGADANITNINTTNFTGTNTYSTSLRCSSLTGTNGYLGSLTMQSLGATNPTGLNYYEVIAPSIQNFTGPWLTSVGTNISYQRLGNVVTCQIGDGLSATNTNTDDITATLTTLPTNFLPATSMAIPVSIINNSALANGALTIFPPSKKITITPVGGVFALGNSGLNGTSFSWSVV